MILRNFDGSLRLLESILPFLVLNLGKMWVR